MIEILDELIVVIFEFLKTVVIVEKLVDGAVLAAQKVLDGRTALASVVRPEVAA